MVATGDMITSALSYTGDAFVEEWPPRSNSVMSLDFETLLPGHGNVFKEDHIRTLHAHRGDFYQHVYNIPEAGRAA